MKCETRDAAAMWRNGITNTILVVDMISNRVPKAKRRGKAFREFEASIDASLESWVTYSRKCQPASYDEAEALWKSWLKDYFQQSEVCHD